VAYCDADYAELDIDDRKSRFGYILMLNGGSVSWGSRKQPCIATSTTEAEYIATNVATQEIIWLCRLLHDLRYFQTGPTILYNDNQAAIHLIRNPEFHQRTMHIDVKLHKIREAEAQEKIHIYHLCQYI